MDFLTKPVIHKASILDIAIAVALCVVILAITLPHCAAIQQAR